MNGLYFVTVRFNKWFCESRNRHAICFVSDNDRCTVWWFAMNGYPDEEY